MTQENPPVPENINHLTEEIENNLENSSPNEQQKEPVKAKEIEGVGLKQEEINEIERLEHQIRFEKNKSSQDEVKKFNNSGFLYSTNYKKQPTGIKKFFVGAFAGLLSLGSLKANAGTNSPEDSTIKNNKIENFADSTKQNNLEIYTKSNTKEGGTTPTGLSNSFFENKDNLTKNDLTTIAEKYNFRTNNNENFQSDLVDYLVENNPEIIEDILEDYDQPLKGRGIKKESSLKEKAEGLKDGLLGVRTKKMIEKLETIVKEETSVSKKENIEEESPQPKGGYVINVRGDEPGSLGTYYFFEDKKDFMEATDKIGTFSSREIYGDDTGQATINMNNDVFLEYHAKNNQDLLGQAWTRNKSNPNKFELNKTTSYSSGLAKK